MYVNLISYQEECLISVFEEWKILEFNEPDGDVLLVDEETCEQHEGDDQHRGQCHCQLLVREDRWDNKCITTSCAIDQNHNTHYNILWENLTFNLQ